MVRRIVCCLLFVCVSGFFLSLEAAEGGEKQLKFKTQNGEKAFQEGKEAFLNKDLKEATKKFFAAKREVADRQTARVVAGWLNGLKGLKALLLIERRVEKHPAWAYINAEKQLIYYYNNPAGDLFRDFIKELKRPEKKLIKNVEDFESRGVYSAKFGRTYCYKTKKPQFVVEGQRSLKWECKNRSSQALVIKKMPKDCSKYRYLGFWLYGAPGKASKLQLYITNKSKRKGKGRQVRFDGFQAQLPPHKEWKYIVLDLNKDFKRRGTGSLANVDSFQLQLPVKKSFYTYIDEIVLIRQPEKKRSAQQRKK